LRPLVRVLLKYLPFQFGQNRLQKLIRRAMDAAGFDHLTLHDGACLGQYPLPKGAAWWVDVQIFAAGSIVRRLLL
jgi:hypothetical protein